MLELMLKGAAPPIAAALLLVSLGGARLLPLAIAIGSFVACVLLQRDWPELPHRLWRDPDMTGWLAWGLLAICAVALLEHLRVLRGRVALGAAMVVACAVVWLTLAKVASRWDLSDQLLLLGGALVFTVASVWAVRRGVERAPAGLLPAIAMTLLLSLDAAVVTLGRSAFAGQMCGAVAAAIGAAAATTIWRRGFALRAADGALVGAVHAVFVLIARHVAYLPWSATISAAVAPLLPLVVPASWTAGRPVRHALLTLPLLLGPLLFAIWLAQPESDPYGY